MQADNSQQLQLLEIQGSNPHGSEFDRPTKDELESLPEPVQRNIETIIQLETEHGQKIPFHHQILERVAAGFSQPKFLYGQIIFFSVWWICSYLSGQGILSKDLAKLNLREDGLSVASLLISTGVLVYQNRQEKVAEERSHLSLQINLLTEQKIVKIITLLEELRTDSPHIHDRQDPEVVEMQQPIDPQSLLTAIKESLNPNEESTPEAANPQTNLPS